MARVGKALVESSGLPEHYLMFIKSFVLSGDVLKASNDSGVSIDTGYKVLRRPDAQGVIHAELRRQLVQAAPMALATLIKLASDTEVSARVRVDAAKAVLDRAGFVPPKAAAPGNGPEKPLNDMGIEDLRAMAERLEAEIAGRARSVNAPQDTDDDVQALDLLD